MKGCASRTCDPQTAPAWRAGAGGAQRGWVGTSSRFWSSTGSPMCSWPSISPPSQHWVTCSLSTFPSWLPVLTQQLLGLQQRVPPPTAATGASSHAGSQEQAMLGLQNSFSIPQNQGIVRFGKALSDHQV